MKTFFFSKTMRERVLMAGFILVAVLWWGSSLLGRVRSLQTDWNLTSTEIEDQKSTMGRKAQVEERAAKVTTLLDPAKTLNATQAYTEVKRLADAQGLPVTIGATRSTDKTDIFALHYLQVTIRQSTLRPLFNFYEELSKKAPYLAIDQCSLSTNRASPGQVDASIRIYSVEVLAPVAPQ